MDILYDFFNDIYYFVEYRMLPPKDPKEDMKHLKEYESMMRAAQKKGRRGGVVQSA